MRLTPTIQGVRTFGQNLREVRESMGMTQEQLMVKLGFKRTTPISLWETGTMLPRPVTIKKVAKALGVQPARLLADIETEYDRMKAAGVPKVAVSNKKSGQYDPPLHGVGDTIGASITKGADAIDARVFKRQEQALRFAKEQFVKLIADMHQIGLRISAIERGKEAGASDASQTRSRRDHGTGLG